MATSPWLRLRKRKEKKEPCTVYLEQTCSPKKKMYKIKKFEI